ncbi:hypothetical protein A1D23_12390 [Chelonobacter oris]|nr:hypothetical protein [Chelonobacter oris]
MDWRIAELRNATPQEEKLQEEIDEYFYQFTGLEDLIIDLMDAVGHGFSAVEIEWRQRDNKWIPAKLYHRPASWFKLDKDDNLLLKTPDNSKGEPLRPLIGFAYLIGSLSFFAVFKRIAESAAIAWDNATQAGRKSVRSQHVLRGDIFDIVEAYQYDEVRPLQEIISEAINRDPDIKDRLQVRFDLPENLRVEKKSNA